MIPLQKAVAVHDVSVDGAEGDGDLIAIHGLLIAGGGLGEGLSEGLGFLVLVVGDPQWSPFGEGEGAVEQVSEIVGELGVEEHDDAGQVEGAVFPAVDVADEVVAEGVDAEFLGDFRRVDDVSEGLGHLLFLASLAFDVPPTVDEEGGHLLIGEAHGVEHAGPVDGVCGDEDVFADDVGVGGPERVEVGEG